MPYHYPIPKDSSKAFNSLQLNQTTNPGLIFERFAPDWQFDKEEAKQEGLRAVATKYKVDSKTLEACLKRWQAIVKHTHAQSFGMKTDWRFIPGLGRKGPLEVGFTFHRHGFPVLPGSSVKGIARAGARLELGLKLDPEDQDSEDSSRDFAAQYPQYAQKGNDYLRDFFDIFGKAPQPGDEDSAQAGGAIFFDALPASPPVLKLDIMNPHFPDYYNQQSAYPTDSQNPIPVKFLVVAAGQEFRFAVGWRGSQDKPELRRKAEEWLKLGLENIGAGAKTSAGYGYFELLAPPTPKVEVGGALPTESPKPQIPDHPLKGAVWKKGRVSKDGRSISDLNAPEIPIGFRPENVLPKGYTPARKSEIHFLVEDLPGGGKRVWVKKLHYPTE